MSDRRHPAAVTSERLLDAAQRWSRQLTEEEKDALTLTRQALNRIAERAIKPELPEEV